MRHGVVFGVLTVALLAGCDSTTEGSPSPAGDSGGGQVVTSGEVATLAPVCAALEDVAHRIGLPADSRYEPIAHEGYEGGPGEACAVRSDTLESDANRGFELTVTANVHPGGADAMAERIKVFEPLPGEPVEDKKIDIDGADVAFLAPEVTNKAILYAFKGNLEVVVAYDDDKVGYDAVVDQSKILASAVIGANRFE